MKKVITLISVLAAMAAVSTGCSVNIQVEPEEVAQVLSNPAVSELADKAAENLVLNIENDSVSVNNTSDENISSDEQNITPESENTSDDIQNSISADENLPDKKENAHIVYPKGEPGFDGIDVDDMQCGTVGDDGEYYVINFLKNKEFQDQINADIRKVSDELYKYAGDYNYTSEELWNPCGFYSFNTQGLIMSARCENGFLGLEFYYQGEPDSNGLYNHDHITALTYDIINEKKIESIDELFTTGCYDGLNEMFNEIEISDNSYTFTEEITPSNITAFTPWNLFVGGSEKIYPMGFASWREDNGTFKYDIGKFYIPAYKRDMTDYIDPAYSMYHNQFFGK